MKEYLKPEAEYISLQAEEAITDEEYDEYILDGETGLASSIFD